MGQVGELDELPGVRRALHSWGACAVPVITRIAGTGVAGGGGDDGRATEAELNQPGGVAVTADGGFLIADTGNHVVRKVSLKGVITRVAGTGAAANSGDNGPAIDAELHSPTAVATTADGGFLIADFSAGAVRKVSSEGVITRVAGTGAAGYSGDGGPAIDAELFLTFGVAVTADGGFLIADTGNHAVRKVSPDGVITTVAGTGSMGNGGDDGPAIHAQLNFPQGVAASSDNGFFIADTGNHVVRNVSPQGVITRVAGTTSIAGNSGDDGPATDAELNGPASVAVAADGGFLIVDGSNNVVRRVSPEGVITRVAGTGTAGNSGDDGPATAAEFNLPVSLAFTADGGFLIGDKGNNVVRKVAATD